MVSSPKKAIPRLLLLGSVVFALRLISFFTGHITPYIEWARLRGRCQPTRIDGAGPRSCQQARIRRPLGSVADICWSIICVFARNSFGLAYSRSYRNKKYIGKVKQAVFHTQKTGRSVVVYTEENIIASLDLRRGDIFWRHVLGKNDPVDQIDIALGKYAVTLSSEGSTLRAWNLPDGLLIWETILQVSTLSEPPLYVSLSKQ